MHHDAVFLIAATKGDNAVFGRMRPHDKTVFVAVDAVFLFGYAETKQGVHGG